MSRRNLLRGAALATAGAAVSGLPGVPAAQGASEDSETSVRSVKLPAPNTETDVYATFGEALGEFSSSSSALALDLIVQFRITDPDATITINVRKSEAHRVDFGSTKLTPDTWVAMQMPDAHELWLARTSSLVLVNSGKLTFGGRRPRDLLLLMPLARQVSFPRYADLLASQATVA
ncbi:MAG: hypothetical protein U0R52_00940 [Solirubrobacterales bacterium]